MQTVGRLCRSHLRPLFLPATYVASRTAPPPPQTPIKIAYDVAGTVVTLLVLNFTAAPFMLLTLRDSMIGWARLSWYGFWIVFGALGFFYAGGTGYLKHLQMTRLKQAGVKVDKEVKTNGNGSGTVTPRVQTMPPLDDVAREVENSPFMRKINA